jgi:hypothetical protein
MKYLLMTAALLLMISGPEAMAQSGRSDTPSASPATRMAPIGHRQPRPSDIPSGKKLDHQNDPIAREDAELNRKIKSICRGC